VPVSGFANPPAKTANPALVRSYAVVARQRQSSAPRADLFVQQIGLLDKPLKLFGLSVGQ
jgi:hypothetical protein